MSCFVQYWGKPCFNKYTGTPPRPRQCGQNLVGQTPFGSDSCGHLDGVLSGQGARPLFHTANILCLKYQ